MSKTTLCIRSKITGALNTREIPWPRAELLAWLSQDPSARPYVQDAFPSLSPDDREFLLTGTTPEEWEKLFGDQSEEARPFLTFPWVSARAKAYLVQVLSLGHLSSTPSEPETFEPEYNLLSPTGTPLLPEIELTAEEERALLTTIIELGREEASA